MPPDQQASQPQSNQPLFGGPFPAAVTPPPAPTPQPPESPRRTWLIAGIIGGVLLLVLLLITAIVLVSSDRNKKTAGTAESNSSNARAEGPAPATSSSVQFSNDSISQDISSLNEDKDFPAGKLSDQNLGL